MDDGLSIIGVAIASLIILVSLIPAASLFTAATVTSVSGQARVIASNIATQVVEADRSLLANDFSGFEYQYWYLPNVSNPFAGANPDPIPPGICTSGNTGAPVSPCLVLSAGLGGHFTVSQNVSWVPVNDMTALEIVASVEWTIGSSAGSVHVKTQVAAPSSVAALSSNSGDPRLLTLTEPLPAVFPTTGQVSVYAVNSDGSGDSYPTAFLGTLPAQQVKNYPYFLVNNDNYDIAFTWGPSGGLGSGGLLCSSTSTVCQLTSSWKNQVLQ